jgi:ribosome biogenesis GTPase / thiamine phosphate phosphatase
MRKSDQKRLEQKLAGLSEAHRKRLYKQAARVRKAAQIKAGRKSTGSNENSRDWQSADESISFEKRSGPAPMSLEDWVLRLLEKKHLDIELTTPELPAELYHGTVISTGAGRCQLLHKQRLRNAILRPELTVAQRSDLATGDVVDFSVSTDGTHIVEQVHPRKTILSRPDPHDPRLERVIAANIDIAVIVSSVKAPPLNTNIIDRYLLAIERGGITPLICVNKIDLISSDADLSTLESRFLTYKEMGITVLYCSALAEEGIDDLTENLSGRLSVFVGHSGVGKSSILNAIDPSLALSTNHVRKKNQKGRHTTAATTLYDLPSDVKIIDTPGVRSFGLWKMSTRELRWYFSEFEAFTAQCKFSDCSHTHEPECAVQQAVTDGKIQSVRYESYCRILETLAREK